MIQKKFYLLLLVALSVFTFSACSSDKDNGEEEEGSTPSYDEYIDANTEAILKKIDFVIHEGDTPPTVEGKYFGEKIVVTKSTILYDGYLLYPDKIGEMTYNLFDQKPNKTISSKLEMKYTYSLIPTTEEYSGKGTLITGSGNDFTIYSIYDGVLHSSKGDAKAKLLYLISATLVKDENGNSTALKDVSSILLMLDDYGDPLNVLIENNQARKFVSLKDAKKVS